MSVKVEKHQQFPEIYWASLEKKKLATKNLVPGRNVYGERLIKYINVEDISYILYIVVPLSVCLNNVQPVNYYRQ